MRDPDVVKDSRFQKTLKKYPVRVITGEKMDLALITFNQLTLLISLRNKGRSS